jgi:hypothetical protein
LRIQSRKGFDGDEDIEAYTLAYKRHQEHVTTWQDVEAYYKDQAIHQPFKYITILGDDTKSRGFPNLTNRSWKSLGSTPRVHFVPFLFENYATDEQVYVYSLKGKYKKGGNRWATTMHSIVRAIKERDCPAATADTLVFIGDNYGENKNNANLAFCMMMVFEGWFKEVQLLYGPVGHTHNKIDATHSVHNVEVGGLTAGTLAEFIALFTSVWSDRTPQAMLMDVQLDYVKHFKHAFRPLSGFTKTRMDPGTAQAFLIQRSKKTGKVELRWKPVASLTAPWLGVDGFPDSEGFAQLKKYTPIGSPPFVKPHKPVMDQKSIGTMLSVNMEAALEKERIPEAFAWIASVARKSEVPLVNEIQETRPVGCMGRLCEIGAGDKIVRIQVLDEKGFAADLEGQSFWACPKMGKEKMAARQAKIEAVIANATTEATARVRYTKEPDPLDANATAQQQDRYMDERVLDKVITENEKLRKQIKELHKKIKAGKEGEKEKKPPKAKARKTKPPAAVVGGEPADVVAPPRARRAAAADEWDSDAPEESEEKSAGEETEQEEEETYEDEAEGSSIAERAGEAAAEGQPGAYVMEKITRHRRRKDGGPGLEYLVKWVGYPPSASTWEPPASFGSPVWVEEYNAELEEAREAKRQARKLEEKSLAAAKEPRGANYATYDEQFLAELENLAPRRPTGRGRPAAPSVQPSASDVLDEGAEQSDTPPTPPPPPPPEELGTPAPSLESESAAQAERPPGDSPQACSQSPPESSSSVPEADPQRSIDVSAELPGKQKGQKRKAFGMAAGIAALETARGKRRRR